MSSTVNMDMALISSSNILPAEQLKKVFEECVKELGGVISNNNLIIGNELLGRLTINSRIILSFQNDLDNAKRVQYRGLLRETFTKRVAVVHENYLFELEQKKINLAKQAAVKQELLESLEQTEEEIEKTKIGFERQQLSECDALKAEIVDAAIAQGYEVVEEKTDSGVQLQFIRREY